MRRYSVDFVSPCLGKSLADPRFVSGGEAIWSVFRPVIGTESSLGEALPSMPVIVGPSLVGLSSVGAWLCGSGASEVGRADEAGA